MKYHVRATVGTKEVLNEEMEIDHSGEALRDTVFSRVLTALVEELDYTFTPLQSAIEIGGKYTQRNTYRNKAVLTAKQIEKIHELQEGTVEDLFKLNRDLLVPNIDYYYISGDGIRCFTLTGYALMGNSFILAEKGRVIFSEVVHRYFG